MPDVEDEIIETAHILKALLEKLYRAAKERRNEKVQEDIKGILLGFTNELQKGVDSRGELKSILDKQKDEFLRVKKELGISDSKNLDASLLAARESVQGKNHSKVVKEFVFGKYDANVIFREFKKDGLTEDYLKVRLMKRYSNIDEAMVQYDIYMARINKLMKHGYVVKDDIGTYCITQEGMVKAEEVRKTFVFTMYDVDVVFKYIENAQGALSAENLKEQLGKEYTDQEYIDKQVVYLTKRLEENYKIGTVSKSEEGRYSITEKGLKKAIDLRDGKVSVPEENDLVQRDKIDVSNGRTDEVGINDVKKLDMSLVEVKEKVQIRQQVKMIKEFVFGKYDANVIFRAFDKTGITEEGLKFKLMKRHSDVGEAMDQHDIYMARINKLMRHGYVEKDNEGVYRITAEGLAKADEVRKTFDFTMYDVDVVFKYIENANGALSVEVLKEQLGKEYTDAEYVEKQVKYLAKRLDDNCKLGTVSKSVDGLYSITDDGKSKGVKLRAGDDNTQNKTQRKEMGRKRKHIR